jgi:hypothetical protein
MATFDQLSAEQRAIIELVLKQGQSYDQLADMLGTSASRVRELARDALADLSPVTAGPVDAEWRAQVADYLLGQQSGPESTATRGHLRRSEAARTWARSLLDSLEGLYADGLPSVPDGEREAPRLRPRGRRRRAARERPVPERPPRPPVSPATQARLRRRRILAAAGAAVVVLFAVLVFPIGLLTGDDDDGDGGGGRAQAQARVVGQIVLRPQDGEDGAGIAVIAERGERPQLIVQARLRPNRNREAYEVWLYNSGDDARSLGAQVTDRQGTYQGAGALPADYRRFRFIDISRERIDENRRHSGDSVLRGRLDEVQRPPAGGGQGTAPTAP